MCAVSVDIRAGSTGRGPGPDGIRSFPGFVVWPGVVRDGVPLCTSGGGVTESAAQTRTVRWIDSSLQNGQVDRHDFPKPEVITSVGFVVEETEEHITLARDDMGDGDYRGLCCIPKIAVLT